MTDRSTAFKKNMEELGVMTPSVAPVLHSDIVANATLTGAALRDPGQGIKAATNGSLGYGMSQTMQMGGEFIGSLLGKKPEAPTSQLQAQMRPSPVAFGL